MKNIAGVAAALALLGVTAWAANKRGAPMEREFSVSADGIGGHIDFTVQVSSPDKTTQHLAISVVGMNNTGHPLRRVCFCVQLEGGKCSGRFWTTARWMPGDAVGWSFVVDGKQQELSATRIADLNASGIVLTLEDAQRDWFMDIRKVFVDTPGGEFDQLNDLVREQVMAALVNSGRFRLVDDPLKADAVIYGRAERRERGTQVRSSEQQQGVDRVSGIAGGVGGRSNGVVAGLVFGREKASGAAAAETSSQTEVLFSEYLILRLTTKAGDSIWAWDDTKRCAGSHPKCAIDDLKKATEIPTTPDGQ